MAYSINIIINNRIWYDSRIEVNTPVVFQNVNYATGDPRSVNVVRQRFMQDWARRSIPNSIRQGIGLTDPDGINDQIVVTQGYAIVGGRFLDIPTGTYDASVEGLTGDGGSPIDHYFMIRVSPEIEGDGRKPSLESAALVAIPISTYLATEKSHNDLVLAKFRYNGSVIDQFADYAKEQEWQVNVISPPATVPGLSTAPTEEILLRAGAFERIDIMNIETDKVRFYLNAVFNDQVVTPGTEIKLINKSGQMQISSTAEDELLGLTLLELYTGTADDTDNIRIDSSGNLTNIGTINTGTIGGDSISVDIIDRGSTQTLTNKTLTSPIQTGGTLNAGAALTVDSDELNQIASGIIRGGTGTGDIITTDNTQTMIQKTLTTPVISSIYQNAGLTQLMTLPDAPTDIFALLAFPQTLQNKILKDFTIWDNESGGTKVYDITPSGTLSANRVANLPALGAEDTFVFEDHTATLINKTLTSPNINEAKALTATSSDLNQLDGVIVGGGSIGDIVDLDTGQTLTNKTLPEIDVFQMRGSGNAEWINLAWVGVSDVARYDVDSHGSPIDGGTSTGSVSMFSLTGIPYNRGSESLWVARIRATAQGDSTNYVSGVTSYWITEADGKSNSSNHLSGTLGESGIESQTMDITNVDLGSYKRWSLTVGTITDTVLKPVIWIIQAEVYYA